MKMKIIIAFSVLALTLNASAQTLTLGFDLSGSNPLLSHENFAFSAARYAGDKIRLLKSGDRVQLKTFGARDNALNLINRRITINRQNRPDKVAKMVERFILSLPVQDNIDQQSTNLVAWLKFSEDFDCENKSEILVITDGIESSFYVGGKDFIAGRKGLPKADVNLKGCTLTFYGLGAGWPPKNVKTIRKAWRTYAREANLTFKSIIH